MNRVESNNMLCTVCGAVYKMFRNPYHESNHYEMKYVNEDNNGRYFSNRYTGVCPSCTIERKKN